MRTPRWMAAAAVAAALVVGCGGDGGADAPEIDPYEVYLEHNPDKSLVLSREDAQLRAQLGCEEKWAPGTVDAVLQEAYSDYC